MMTRKTIDDLTFRAPSQINETHYASGSRIGSSEPRDKALFNSSVFEVNSTER